MALSTITARVDDKDKTAFDAFCNSVGLTTSAAINLFVKRVNLLHRIPFDISDYPDDPFFNPSNQAYVIKSVNELKEGKGTVHELIED